MLRGVEETDLPIFFEYESDPAAVHMAAFTAKNPADRAVFDAHWKRILSDEAVIVRTVLFEGHVVGSVASFIDQEFGKREVTYWIGRQYWGKGIATKALSKFLRELKVRPFTRALQKIMFLPCEYWKNAGSRLLAMGGVLQMRAAKRSKKLSFN